MPYEAELRRELFTPISLTYILLHLFFCLGRRDRLHSIYNTTYLLTYIVTNTYIAEQRTFYGKKVRRSWLLKRL